MCPYKPTTNISNFSAKGSLGQLFEQAKVYNQINEQLQPLLPETLKSLELCLIKEGVATLITNNPAVAFRAKQQLDKIMALLHTISKAGKINHIEIKVATNT
jgi:hypothetical protein